MVGNDIVDLRDPESQAERLHPRFDTRVFTAREREVIAADGGSSRERWKLWAAKEAAYKLLRKRTPSTVFSPFRFEVASEASNRAVVAHGESRVRIDYQANTAAVHAVAVATERTSAEILSGWRRLSASELAAGDPEVPSRAVRAFACERVALRLGLAVSELEISREGRVPFLCVAGKRAKADLSLSHHGDWVGFACELWGLAS